MILDNVKQVLQLIGQQQRKAEINKFFHVRFFKLCYK
jgi:hypothetical protein